jgi:hypothetical protein
METPKTEINGEDYERQTLTAVCKDRKSWEQISRFAEHSDFTERGRIIWQEACDYYKRDEKAQSVDYETIKGHIFLKVKRREHRHVFSDILDKISSSAVSPENATQYFLALKREDAGISLAGALSGGASRSEVEKLLAEYNKLLSVDSLEQTRALEVAQGKAVREVVEHSYGGDNLIKIYPKSLNERLGGGLLPGHHMIVFARPEMGKTLVTLNLVFGFLAQGKKVLYACNEEPLDDLIIRLVSRLSLTPRAGIVADPETANKKAIEKGYENVVLAHMTPGTLGEIDALLEEHKPHVLIVDQLRHLNVSRRNDNKTTQLEAAANGIRSLIAKHACLGVSVTQAGDSAAGKSVLSLGDVDSSNTGIPGACDVMLGIGGTEQDIALGRRILSLPKNKPGGGGHDSFPVSVVESIGRLIG